MLCAVVHAAVSSQAHLGQIGPGDGEAANCFCIVAACIVSGYSLDPVGANIFGQRIAVAFLIPGSAVVVAPVQFCCVVKSAVGEYNRGSGERLAIVGFFGDKAIPAFGAFHKVQRFDLQLAGERGDIGVAGFSLNGKAVFAGI